MAHFFGSNGVKDDVPESIILKDASGRYWQLAVDGGNLSISEVKTP